MCKDEGMRWMRARMNGYINDEWINGIIKPVVCRLYEIGQFEIVPTDGVFWN